MCSRLADSLCPLLSASFARRWVVGVGGAVCKGCAKIPNSTERKKACGREKFRGGGCGGSLDAII